MRLLTAAVALATCAAWTLDRDLDPRVAPGGYRWVGDAPATATLDLVIAVKLSNAQALESTLYAVSDPQSPSYGKHWTREQVWDLTRPSAASQAAVEAWLSSQGVPFSWMNGGSFVSARVSVAQAESLLAADYHQYQSGNLTFYRAKAYSLPPHVSAHVDFVAPTTLFPTVRTIRSRRASPGSPLSGVTPTLIRQMYGVGNDASKVPSNKQQAAGFLEQYASLSDLKSFFAQFWPASNGISPTIIGPNDQSNPGLEADLDVQYIMSVGSGVNTTYWYTDGQRPYGNEPFVDWLVNVTALSDTNLPKTISVSYGDNEDTVEYAYASRANQEFQALGVRGVSIQFSSGDGGVAGSQPSQCKSGFIPTFPAASPYVTAVGATDNPGAEIVASFSSGGFSNYWDRPSYQTSAVANYLATAKGLPPANMYNHSGAGFPDVAAIGTNFNIVCGGFTTQVDGTSCSSPTFTGMVSLLNDHRLAAGKSTLGWLNPLIYQHPEIFHSITSGSNPGCGTNGFPAAPGWTPATGMGTLDYQKALTLVMSLP